MSPEFDSFPSNFSCELKCLAIPKDCVKSRTEPFISLLLNDKIIFNFIQFSSRTVKNFEFTLREASRTFKYAKENIEWVVVQRRLRRPDFQTKKNLDQSLAFRHGNVFLTKKYFTFGLRKTEPGECHVYQTGARPLFFYVPKNIACPPFTEGHFPWRNKNDYDCYVLEPEFTYMVRENSTYLILTMCKSLFSVDKCKFSDVAHLPVKSPTDTPFGDWKVTPAIALGKKSTKRKHDSCHEKEQLVSNLQQPQPSTVTVSQNAETDSKVFLEMNSQNAETTSQMVQGKNPEYSQTVERPSNCESQYAGASTSFNDINESFDTSTPQPSLLDNAPLENSSDTPLHHTTVSVNSNTTQNSLDDNVQPYSTMQGRALLPVIESTSSQTNYPLVNDEPAPFKHVDEAGNAYQYIPIDLNWNVNEARSLKVLPFMTQANGKVFIYAPIKVNKSK